jgi:hypothetical protein
VDNAGNAELFGDPEAATTVDTRAPATRVTAPTGILNTTSFTVRWTGDDGGGSGIRYYDVQYRLNGGTWQPWQQQTVATDAVFVAPGEGFYEFEVRAVDNLGLQEDFLNRAESAAIVDIAPPFVAPVLWFTFIAEQAVPSG